MINVVGHRGLPAHYPENTLVGLKAALAAGAQGVEIDIQFSKDAEPVLLHDMSLKRVTGLTGNANTFDINLLTKISAHEPSRFGDRFLPTPIPALNDLIALMREYPTAKIFVEIKEESFEHLTREQIVAKVALCLAPIADQVVIISYDLPVLRILRSQVDWPVGWVLTHYDNPSRDLAAEFQPDYLISNVNKLPTQQPLWVGVWQWFIYDITESPLALSWAKRGVNWAESWDAVSLLADIHASA